MDTGISTSFFYNTMRSMYKANFKLKHAGITAHSVKIDAFTIKAEDKKNPRKYLNYIRKIGGWTVRKYADIK